MRSMSRCVWRPGEARKHAVANSCAHSSCSSALQSYSVYVMPISSRQFLVAMLAGQVGVEEKICTADNSFQSRSAGAVIDSILVTAARRASLVDGAAAGVYATHTGRSVCQQKSVSSAPAARISLGCRINKKTICGVLGTLSTLTAYPRMKRNHRVKCAPCWTPAVSTLSGERAHRARGEGGRETYREADPPRQPPTYRRTYGRASTPLITDRSMTDRPWPMDAPR